MYYSEIDEALYVGAFAKEDAVFPAKPPRCEYLHAQFDGGTQQGRMIQCRNKAAMWTNRGLRCTDHKED